MIDYSVLYKEELPVIGNWPASASWDTFISAYTAAERVKAVYERVPASEKHWLVFPEYGFNPAEYPDTAYASSLRDEAAYIREFWSKRIGSFRVGSLCVDITGFIRPYLIFLLRWLAEQKVTRFDALYTEPVIYAKRDQTKFSDEVVVEVRQIAGYEGIHTADTSNDYLIIGAGYDHQLIAQVAENKEFSRKVQIFGLPSLRADMYQENILRAYRAEEAVGRHTENQSSSHFSPANDPFVTASKLREIVSTINARKPITNLYLSPLATKPQVLGFAIFYLTEHRNSATSLIFPFCETYNQETTSGLSRIWRYTVELPVI